MQVHKATFATPCMASTHPADALLCMQIHAPYECTALYKPACQKKGFRMANSRYKKAAV